MTSLTIHCRPPLPPLRFVGCELDIHQHALLIREVDGEKAGQIVCVVNSSDWTHVERKIES